MAIFFIIAITVKVMPVTGEFIILVSKTYMFEMFHNKSINKSGAQLIATTHDVSIMSPENLARDEIWFIQKDPQKGNSSI